MSEFLVIPNPGTKPFEDFIPFKYENKFKRQKEWSGVWLVGTRQVKGGQMDAYQRGLRCLRTQPQWGSRRSLI